MIIIKALYDYINYDSGIINLVSSYIREYDIRKANINILYKYKVIDYDTYNRCLSMNKLDREIFIGKLQAANPFATKVLQKGILEAKKQFFLANDIQPEEVLCIKNDAVFLINKIAKVTQFDNIEFVNKNLFTSFIKIGRIEFYYYLDSIHRKEVLDIKGISRNTQTYHEKYLIKVIKKIFNILQSNPVSAMQYFNTFMNDYLNLRLDVGYYMDLDKRCYKLKKISNYIDNIYVESIADKDKLYVDFSYNLQILNNIGSVISNIILNNKFNGSTF